MVATMTILYKPNRKDAHFKINKDGLQYHNNKNRHVTLVQTFRENEAYYSEQQIKNAKLSRELYAKDGYLIKKHFKNLIKYNLINNFPVNIEDTNSSREIYKLNISALKGKATRRNTDPVVTDYITVEK